jgi:hypothetical protein
LKSALDAIAALPAPGPKPEDEPPPAAEPTYAAADEPPPEPIAFDPRKGEKLWMVERALDRDERAYFEVLRSRLRATALEAIRPLEGCALAEGSGSTDADLGSAVLTPGGFAPRGLDIWVQCAGGTKIGFRIAAEPAALKKPEEQATWLGPDALLLESRRIVRLAIGRLEAAPTLPTFVPGLLRLGAVELTANVVDQAEAERAREMLSKVDRTRLRALLAEPPKPAASRRVAEESEKADGKRVPVVAEVYRAIFDVLGGQQVMVVDETSKVSLGESFLPFAKTAMPDVLPSALESFERRAPRSVPLPQVAWRGPVVRLTEQEIDEIFDSQRGGGWKAFREKYPAAGAILRLSRVGLSLDRSQAVVAVDWQADALAGAGEIWFLTRTENGWRVIYKVIRWIS